MLGNRNFQCSFKNGVNQRAGQGPNLRGLQKLALSLVQCRTSRHHQRESLYLHTFILSIVEHYNFIVPFQVKGKGNFSTMGLALVGLVKLNLINKSNPPICRRNVYVLFAWKRGESSSVQILQQGKFHSYFVTSKMQSHAFCRIVQTIIWTPPTAKLLDGIGRPNSPNSLSHKHIDRTESLSMASPSSSGI